MGCLIRVLVGCRLFVGLLGFGFVVICVGFFALDCWLFAASGFIVFERF